MDYQSLPIADVILFTPKRHADGRGYFSEIFRQNTFAQAVLEQAVSGFPKTKTDFTFVQDNQSLSKPAGTVRGLHYQAPPHAQGKLVSCASGAITDVAVDIRFGSATYGQYVRAQLSAQNGHQLWIPPGFLHGFATLAPDTIVQYKCTDYYASDCEGSVAWDDTDLAIDWGLGARLPVLSDKDRAAQNFANFTSPFRL